MQNTQELECQKPNRKATHNYLKQLLTILAEASPYQRTPYPNSLINFLVRKAKF